VNKKEINEIKELLVTNPETTILQYEGRGKPGIGY